jgi:hypothetical protein
MAPPVISNYLGSPLVKADWDGSLTDGEQYTPMAAFVNQPLTPITPWGIQLAEAGNAMTAITTMITAKA